MRIQKRHDSPCDRECPKRSSDCHGKGKCPDYDIYVEAQKAKRKARFDDSIWTRGKDITKGKAKHPVQKNIIRGDLI